jgi:predicted RND superfamily exporter protein
MKTKNTNRIAWLIITMVLLVTVYFFMGMKKNARMETNLDEYMPKTHPAFVYSDKAEEWFNINDGIMIAIENKDGIYNATSLQKIKDITKELEDMDAFNDNDIMSLYSADNITGSEYGMEVESFYKKVPDSQEKIEELRAKVKSNDMVFGRLISRDETVALIVASMTDSTFTQSLYQELIVFAESFETVGDVIYVAGRPIVEGTLGLLGPADMKRMVPIVIILIIIVLYILLRSVRATFATMLTVFLSSIWTFGLMAVLDVPIYSVSTMIPVMLIAIGVAYGIYFYNNLIHFFKQNPDKTRLEAIMYSAKKLLKPLSMAAFTTIIGFLSLLTSQVYPIKYFGIFTAFGIFVAFLLTMLLIPAFTLLTGFRLRNKKVPNVDIDEVKKIRVTDHLLKKSRPVYLGFGLVILISIFGLTKIWINSSFLDKFAKDSDIVLTDTFVNSKFGGTSTLNVILESSNKGVFKNPEILRLIDRLQNRTEELAEVGNSFSLNDYLKRMNKVMNEDDSSYYTIPETSELVAQYLLLYEMSGDPENLTKVVNYDYNRTNITFQLKGDDSRTINSAINCIEDFRPDLESQGIEVNYAGSGYKALIFTDLILKGQVSSIVLSLILVLILLIAMFRSWKAGLIGSVPIIITALISFGVMGLLNIPLSTTTALLSSIAIGIGIDYSIHFIQNYKTGIKNFPTRHEAIHQTMKQTGKAILFNAIVVISGFMVLLFSVFPPNRTLGALVSMNMFTSFIGTLSIMMILLYKSRVFQRKS